jgi:hypothetical protein
LLRCIKIGLCGAHVEASQRGHCRLLCHIDVDAAVVATRWAMLLGAAAVAAVLILAAVARYAAGVKLHLRMIAAGEQHGTALSAPAQAAHQLYAAKA